MGNTFVSFVGEGGTDAVSGANSVCSSLPNAGSVPVRSADHPPVLCRCLQIQVAQTLDAEPRLPDAVHRRRPQPQTLAGEGAADMPRPASERKLAPVLHLPHFVDRAELQLRQPFGKWTRTRS